MLFAVYTYKLLRMEKSCFEIETPHRDEKLHGFCAQFVHHCIKTMILKHAFERFLFLLQFLQLRLVEKILQKRITRRK